MKVKLSDRCLQDIDYIYSASNYVIAKRGVTLYFDISSITSSLFNSHKYDYLYKSDEKLTLSDVCYAILLVGIFIGLPIYGGYILIKDML